MITADDIQISVGTSRDPRIRLSPIAASLLATLLNGWIYEDTRRLSLNQRHSVATAFVFDEMPGVLSQLVGEVKRSREGVAEDSISSMDIVHWLIPQWPAQLRQFKISGFIFNKE